MSMEPREFLRFLSRIEPLKTNTRHCMTAGGAKETVAAHSWRMAVMAMLLRDEFPDIDMDKVTRMCLVHDFGEAITGDIPSFHKTEANERDESAVLSALVDTLPSPQKDGLHALYAEMDALETGEARLYKTLDKLEAVIQHNESELSTWIPREYTLNLTYGADMAVEFPFLKALREEMRQDTEQKIAAGAHSDDHADPQGGGADECMRDYFELIRRRESCRGFADRPVEPDKLRRAVEAACLAPSACNSQPWKFYAVTEPGLRAALAPCVQGLGMNKFASGCPAFVVVAETKPNLSERAAKVLAKKSFVSIDIGLAVSQLCYAATAQGLSTCILGWLSEGKIQTLLHLPDAERARLVVCVGYAADGALREKQRKPLSETAVYFE